MLDHTKWIDINPLKFQKWKSDEWWWYGVMCFGSIVPHLDNMISRWNPWWVEVMCTCGGRFLCNFSYTQYERVLRFRFSVPDWIQIHFERITRVRTETSIYGGNIWTIFDGGKVSSEKHHDLIDWTHSCFLVGDKMSYQSYHANSRNNITDILIILWYLLSCFAYIARSKVTEEYS